MRGSKHSHAVVLFCITLAFADSSNQNFIQNLQRNVGEYGTSHFSWNIQNLDHANYQSLRAIEDDNDREFRAFLLNHSPKVKNLLAREHVTMERNITNGEHEDKTHKTHQRKLRKRDAALPQRMAILIAKAQPRKIIRSLQKREADNTTQMMIYNIDPWFSIADLMSLRFPKKYDDYFNSWSQSIVLFGNSEIHREEFKHNFNRLPLQIMLELLSLTDKFQHIFWPFNFDQAFMNQRLALLGMSGLSINGHKQKERFYAELEKHQTIKVPVEEERVVLSFDHPDLVEGLNRSGLLEMSKEYVEAGNHLYTLKEQEHITSKVQAAMDLINSTNPELYRAIHQVIGCIAFYKAEQPESVGGTISSALGVIWQDPSVYPDHSVANYAEQIVHEFIHSSLFLADMVHGTYIDRSLLTKSKVYSPVRKELRDFDKTFHASYVTTGVTIFQSRAGNVGDAQTYAGTLRAAVDGLIAIQNKAGVLNASGAAMLQAMDDVLTLIRME
ncbi:hypothetical protein MAR_006960 [Mya arenaria]|uniref:Uncharacterized protein n=1 Tax=Mya arenaria TaxID=6604 RepID=A0ABY7DDL9_MYAAR|nr:uncharacterized protein LOC128231983 [Mya arenaria]WAQ94489.1 hypothetical protein MAR_006960 [Mya arenaria]